MKSRETPNRRKARHHRNSRVNVFGFSESEERYMLVAFSDHFDTLFFLFFRVMHSKNANIYKCTLIGIPARCYFIMCRYPPVGLLCLPSLRKLR